MKKFQRILSVLIVLTMFVAPAVSAAQDTDVPPTQESFATVTPDVVTATPDPAVTPAPPVEPGPVIVDQVNFRLGVFGAIVGVITLLLSGMGIGYVWGHIRGSKEAKDSIELAFGSTSPETQEQIRLAYETAGNAWNTVDTFARELLKFLGEVSDFAPNVDDPIVTQKIQAAVNKAFNEALQIQKDESRT